MNEPADPYRKIGTWETENGPLTVWRSPGLTDAPWDDFLRGSPCGQYQQSSLWAQYKACDGWNHHRVILTKADRILGGFQILWKKTRAGRMGYANKGPVVEPPDAGLTRRLNSLLCETTRELGLIALIAQAPDESLPSPAPNEDAVFVQSNPGSLIETTYLIDVSEGMEVVRSRMRPKLRKNLKDGRKSGTIIREGSEADLPLFFSLMSATCARKQTPPNPSSLEAVRQLWQIFAPSKSIRLVVAECEGRAPAAQLNLVFGNRVSIWKEGWDGTYPNWHTGALLEEATLEWAHAQGLKLCDICSLSRSTALRLLAGQKITAETVSSRDLFNVRFGGYPKILPPARIYLPNPMLRWAYRHVLTRFARFR